EVVDLTVEHQRQAGRRVAHRLLRALRINDREPPVAEKYVVVALGARKTAEALIVGPTMRDSREHRDKRFLIRLVRRFGDKSGNSAHRDPCSGPGAQNWSRVRSG